MVENSSIENSLKLQPEDISIQSSVKIKPVQNSIHFEVFPCMKPNCHKICSLSFNQNSTVTATCKCSKTSSFNKTYPLAEFNKLNKKVNLLEEEEYHYTLQNVEEPQLYREIFDYEHVPKIVFNNRRVTI